MPDVWHLWEDPDFGTKIEARKMDGPGSIQYASDGIDRPYQTGDYLTKGHDGLIRIIPEADFEGRCRRLELPPPAPLAEGEAQVLQANTIETGPKPSRATVESR